MSKLEEFFLFAYLLTSSSKNGMFMMKNEDLKEDKK